MNSIDVPLSISQAYHEQEPEYDNIYEKAVAESSSEIKKIRAMMRTPIFDANHKLIKWNESAFKKLQYKYSNINRYNWIFNGKKEIGPADSRYWDIINIVDEFMSQYKPKEGESILQATDMLQITPYKTNYPGIISYPIQVHLQNSDSNDLPWKDTKIEFLHIISDLFTRHFEFSGISLPKNSSVGFPSMENTDDKKVVMFERNLRNITDIINLCNSAKEGDIKSYLQLTVKYEISNVAIQGLRIQNDKHGESGKQREFQIRDKKFKTKVDFSDTDVIKNLPLSRGKFGRRNRVVYGMNYGVNLLTNAIVNPFRNFFYKEYEKTYKVRNAAQLDDEFSNSVDLFGFDVTQLDRNTDTSHVEIINRAFTRWLKPDAKRAYDFLMRMMERPCMVNRYSDYHNETTVTGRYIDVGPVSKNSGVGIASGCSTTSECGKIEVSSFVCANLFSAAEITNEVIAGRHGAIKSAYSLYIKQYNIPVYEQIDVFSHLNIRSKEDFCHRFLKDHFKDNVVFKNMGDDTVLGFSKVTTLLGFVNMLVLCAVNEYRNVKFASHKGMYIEDLYDKLPDAVKRRLRSDICPWHIVDLEEPISYLGNVPHYIDGKIRFLPSTRSFVLNFMMGERTGYLGKTKQITWGIGLQARNKVYFANDNCRRIWQVLNKAYSFVFKTSDTPQKIIDDHARLNRDRFMALAERPNIQVVGEEDEASFMSKFDGGESTGVNLKLTDIDAEVIVNPDLLHYKYTAEDISPGIEYIFLIRREYTQGSTLDKFYSTIWSDYVGFSS